MSSIKDPTLNLSLLLERAVRNHDAQTAFEAIALSSKQDGGDPSVYEYALETLRDAAKGACASCVMCDHAYPDRYQDRIICDKVDHDESKFSELVYQGTTEEHALKVAASFCGHFVRDSAEEREHWLEVDREFEDKMRRMHADAFIF